MSVAELVAALGESARRHLNPESPLPMRMMAAKGVAPLPPTELVIVLCGLTQDPDESVATSAEATLRGLPEKLLGPALDGTLPSVALTILAPRLVGRDDLLQKLVLNRQTPDEAIAGVAAEVSAEVAEIIANNQERCLRSAKIVRAVARNSSVLRSSLDRLFDFLVRSGVILEDMPEFAGALGRLSTSEMLEVAEKVDLPPVVAELVTSEAEESVSPKAAPSAEKTEEAQRAKLSTHQLVSSLNVAQKVALALRGNRDARTLLIRDSNRVVASAAIRSPRITDQEIVNAAQSRSVSDEVVRIIASSKEMTRSYAVKVALVNNPKTHLPTAMRFLTLLRQSDMKAVAKSKNVSAAVANQAKRLLQAKTGGGRR